MPGGEATCLPFEFHRCREVIAIWLKDCSSDGTCVWRVQVDQQPVCDFTLPKLSTLTECLHRAANAAETSAWIDEVIITDSKGG